MTRPRRVVVVVPARNEEARVASVVQAALGATLPTRTVVVANGCSDDTATAAAAAGAEVLELSAAGKGEAVLHAFDSLNLEPEDVVVLLDADLIELTSRHVDALVTPVVTDAADMTCGILAGRFWSTSLAPESWTFHNFWTLTGQRCIRAGLLKDIPRGDVHGYRLEVALNRQCLVSRLRVRRLPLNGVAHVTKEQKQSIPQGWLAKVWMIGQVYLTYTRLWLSHGFARLAAAQGTRC